MQRVIFMGSDPIALPMLRAMQAGQCGEFELIAVYTQPDRQRGRGKKVVPNEIKVWATDAGIPVHQPERMRKEQRLEIEAMQADAIVVMAFGHMLSQKLIGTPKLGIWNLHTSLLPKYRGASPIQCAVASGDVETGVSLMRMVKEMDAGDVLDVERVSIGRLDTALDVDHALAEACVPLMERNVPKILSGEVTPVPQEAASISYVRKFQKDDGVLDFRVEAVVLAKRVNGLFPWPGTSFVFSDTKIKVGLADFSEASAGAAAGTVLGLQDGGLAVACETGTLLLKRLQRPGGKLLPAADFLRGFEIPEGSVIDSVAMPEFVSDQKF